MDEFNVSRADFLLRCATERGVTTQWLKDLGYKVESGEGGWVLIEPKPDGVLHDFAINALGKITASSKIVTNADGSVAYQMPADAALWICKVAEMWREMR